MTKPAFLLPALILLCSCAEPPVGSKQRPFTMYFVPSVEQESIALSAGRITDFVAERVSTDLYGEPGRFEIKSAIPTSYIAVVEAFGTGRADFAALTTFSYILTRDVKGYPVDAILTVIRGGDEHSYKGQIIAHVDSGIQRLEDLKGKKFAFTDPASTSGFLLPQRLFAEMGIELGDEVFAQRHDSVVTMVYQRQVDAGATYYSPPRTEVVDGEPREVIRDARAKVLTQFPDVVDKVRIVGFTEEIPNDPWVMRRGILPEEDEDARLRSVVTRALLEFAGLEDGRKALEDLYNISGLMPADNSTYDRMRQIVTESALNLDALVGR